MPGEFPFNDRAIKSEQLIWKDPVPEKRCFERAWKLNNPWNLQSIRIVSESAPGFPCEQHYIAVQAN